MASLEDHESRLDEHGVRISTLEYDAKMQAGLRAAVDRDLGDLKGAVRAQTEMIQALADTQSGHTATLRDPTARLKAIDQTLDRHGRLHAATHAKLDHIVGPLDRLIDDRPSDN